jgi:hypothetical protein
VDRAFVMADPSMDKQELYVAASRAREQTHLYATPEVQAHRDEIAPASPHLREGISHIAEASERDRAQRAAHDLAQLEALPTKELIERRGALGACARRERVSERERAELQRRIEGDARFLAGMDAQREWAKGLPRKLRRQERARIERTQQRTERLLTRMEAELRQMTPISHRARKELAAVEGVLDERLQAALLAARLAAPTYITKELGERPRNPAKQKVWDRGVAAIEGYRQRNGITDPSRALGRKRAREIEKRAALRRIQEAKQVLGLGQHVARERTLGRGMGIAR